MAGKQSHELRVARLIEYRGLRVPSDKTREIPAMISALSDLVHSNAEKRNLQGAVGVREVFVSPEGADAYRSPLGFVDLAMVIDYASRDGVSVQQAVDDTMLFRDGIKGSMIIKGAELSSRSGRMNDYHISTPIGHDFGCIPLVGRLSKNFEDISVQKNRFSFGARAELTESEVRAIGEIIRANGMSHSLYQSSQSKKPDADGLNARFELDQGKLGLTYGMLAPEIVLDADWDGDDFAGKVWKVYGELREAIYPKYLETSLKYAPNMMNHAILAAAQGRPNSVALNQERLNRGASMKDMWCNFRTEIPVMVGEEKSVFQIGYGRKFLGDSH